MYTSLPLKRIVTFTALFVTTTLPLSVFAYSPVFFDTYEWPADTVYFEEANNFWADTPFEDSFSDPWENVVQPPRFNNDWPTSYEPIEYDFDWDNRDFEFERPIIDWDHEFYGGPEPANPIEEEEEEEEEEIIVPANCSLTPTQLESITNFPARDGVIIAFGDSLTAGVGATPGQEYVNELERLAGVNIINAGISGDTTKDALERLQTDVLAYNPATVIVWLGGNDILGRYYEAIEEETADTFLERILRAIYDLFDKTPRDSDVLTEAETFANLERIVEDIQANGAVVVLVGMDGEPLDNDLGSRYAGLAERTGSIYIPDVLDNIIGRPGRTSDLIHPNNAGYEIVAERIFKGLACTL